MAENKTTPGATLTESGVDLHLELKGSGIRAGLTDALQLEVQINPGLRERRPGSEIGRASCRERVCSVV